VCVGSLFLCHNMQISALEMGTTCFEGLIWCLAVVCVCGVCVCVWSDQMEII